MSDWKWTRPGMAMHNWSAHVPGVTIVPPDPIEWQLAFYSIRSVDTKNQILTVDAFLRTMWTDRGLHSLQLQKADASTTHGAQTAS